jgi:hypothetical protein
MFKSIYPIKVYKNVFGNSYYTSIFIEIRKASYNKKHSMNSILTLIKPSNINFVHVFNKMFNENIVNVRSVF